MYDLVSIGTVAIDMYFKGDTITIEDGRFQLAIGGKYFANGFYEGLGGGATNVAIGAKKLGLNVGLAATIGDNVFRKVIVTKLDELGLDYKLSEFDKDFYNISAVLVSPDGDRSIINYRSSHDDLYDTEEELARLVDTKALYIANLPNLTLERKTEIVKYFQSKNVFTIANLGVSDCKKPTEEIKKFLEHLNVLNLNAHEFSELVKTPYESINFREDFQQKYLPDIKNTLFLVTDGIKGSYAAFNGQTYYQEAIKAEKIVDATGAGDGYTAGFIANYIFSRDIQEAMKSAATYSSQKLGHMGAN